MTADPRHTMTKTERKTPLLSTPGHLDGFIVEERYMSKEKEEKTHKGRRQAKKEAAGRWSGSIVEHESGTRNHTDLTADHVTTHTHAREGKEQTSSSNIIHGLSSWKMSRQRR